MSADITEERIAERLGFLADELRSWLKYNEKGHGKTDEELSGDIHVMLSNGYTDAPPCWPSRSVLKHWIGTLDSARSQLAALQSVPQGVEVPDALALRELRELLGRAINACIPGQGIALADWERACLLSGRFDQPMPDWEARLVPAPPQAAPGPAILNPPKQDRDCGDCTRLAICNGELACLCGPTGKMFDRKAPDYPLQPEERRVGPDEVVVPRSAAEYAIRAFDWIECPDSEHYEAWRAFLDALRTSAQDHNGEGVTAHCGTCAQNGHCVDAKWRVVCDDYLALQAPGQRGEG